MWQTWYPTRPLSHVCLACSFKHTFPGPQFLLVFCSEYRDVEAVSAPQTPPAIFASSEGGKSGGLFSRVSEREVKTPRYYEGKCWGLGRCPCDILYSFDHFKLLCHTLEPQLCINDLMWTLYIYLKKTQRWLSSFEQSFVVCDPWRFGITCSGPGSHRKDQEASEGARLPNLRRGLPRQCQSMSFAMTK